MRKFESVGQYHDVWGWLLLSAPDRFRSFGPEPVDQAQALRAAFDDLRSGFRFARQKLKDERLERICLELIEMSFEAYSTGDTKKGAHILQECDGMIWPGRKLRVKHAVEAERRAFGSNVLYANVRVSPYPYEGTSADLGSDQAALLDLAKRHSKSYQAARRDFKYFAWILGNDGVIRRVSPDPKEDTHPVLPPIQRSWRAMYNRLKELGALSHIRACVLVEIIGPLGGGIVTYDCEQSGRPRVSARQLFKPTDNGSFHYEVMKFHLEDPQFFGEPMAQVQQDAPTDRPPAEGKKT